jgi:hypothetical protein
MKSKILMVAVFCLCGGMSSANAWENWDSWSPSEINLTCYSAKAAVLVGFDSMVCTDDQTGQRYFADIYGVGLSAEASVGMAHINCHAHRPEYWYGVWDKVWVPNKYGSKRHISDKIGYTWESYMHRKTKEFRENFEGVYGPAAQAGFGVGYARPTASQAGNQHDAFGFTNKLGQCDIDSRGIGAGIDVSIGVLWIRSKGPQPK